MMKIIRQPVDKDELLNDAINVVHAVKSELNPHLKHNARNNCCAPYPPDEKAVEKFEDKYEYDQDEYDDYDNMATERIGLLLHVIKGLVELHRPDAKWSYLDFPKVEPKSESNHE